MYVDAMKRFKSLNKFVEIMLEVINESLALEKQISAAQISIAGVSFSRSHTSVQLSIPISAAQLTWCLDGVREFDDLTAKMKYLWLGESSEGGVFLATSGTDKDAPYGKMLICGTSFPDSLLEDIIDSNPLPGIAKALGKDIYPSFLEEVIWKHLLQKKILES